jgi:hypothetical protein
VRTELKLGAAVAVLAAALVPAPRAQTLTAQKAAELVAPKAPGYKAPRTPWGDPDIEGIWPSIDMVRVPLERPRQYGERVIMTAEEHAIAQKREDERIAIMARDGAGGALGAPGHWVEWGTSQLQTSLLIFPLDGRMPALTPEGRARLAAMPRGTIGGGMLSGPSEFTMWERCISRGAIGSTLPVLYNSGIDITQGPGVVAIRYEMVHDFRVIPLDGRPHLPASIDQFMGDARGRWEGDSLVVETTNFTGRIGFGINGGGAPPGPAAQLLERFTRVSPTVIRYEATVVDPQTWTSPWTVAFPLRRDPDYIMAEYACHEGNLGMRNALSGSRSDEAKGMGK